MTLKIGGIVPIVRVMRDTIIQRPVSTFVRYHSKRSRSFKKKANHKPGQVIRSKLGKTLEAPKTQPKLFSFGNFSGLDQPENKLKEMSSNAIKNITSFESLRIFPTVRSAMLEEIKYGYNLKSTYIKSKEELEIKPSPVQIAAIRKINQPRLRNVNAEKKLADKKASGQEILEDLQKSNEMNRLKIFTIAAETGSGKTWAYLAPLLSKLKEEDMRVFNMSEQSYADAKKTSIIRSVILLPTHELVEQVYDSLKRASKASIDLEASVNKKILQDPQYARYLSLPENQTSLNLNVVKWGSGDSHQKLFDAGRKRIDVLVTTPAKIQGLAKLNNVSRPFRLFNFVEYCVVDEADTLMDKSWIVDTTSVIRRLSKCKDLIFCSATIPKEFKKTLGKMFPDEFSIINIVTPSLHKIPKQINLKVIDAQLSPYNGSKTRCLAQALYAIHNDGTEQGYVKRILVFVNEKRDVQPLADTLIEKFGHREEDIIGITGADNADDRLAKIEPFLKPAELLEEDLDGSKVKVLITTDLLARGLNFNGIKNVILMDLPNTSVDLVHRVGRTGRMRQSGRVFVIIDKKTGKSWIKGLPKVIKKGIPLG
ncbi:DEHA2C04378p [Debaryomyces hansenii CBS767]|uniref:ATP-dependent RNA helicase MRH4, mitochondrial n=1 Tax=Debaryomyces hansenii (strain ATCC 36239 / CBS 767 / BCRC 21394 / JCM 1990 / NBRC 0083 / IGC 2968) TaxID=284592 RepID=MRH4_DEBHA|nr:DEHA2C04378p [Debaryomyces hansenii CBS767]Q6BV94.1 RecName: Full=ATP-dependent RNA helicase MRH4, mitochondrial; Flags: Precursor [Debaryomyces hansenii CBS767]CAG85921.1 DEHA2C04378p [Debaryomyces hansenii CBS767]|eukprot:XP_457875.1 DEHA2C04378p [Debaryomyces hansenii CBS767]